MTRCAVVTGSASGIGRATATALNAAGWRVVGIDQHSAQILADLGDERGRAIATEAAIAACGGTLEGLVCAAGIGPTWPSPQIMAVNYFGAVAVARGLLGALKAGRIEPDRAGSAVMVSSNSIGLVPVSDDVLAACARDDEQAALGLAAELDGPTAYAASKIALARWVRKAAPEWARVGVRLNAIAPGPVDTPLLGETWADPVLGPFADALPSPSGRTAATTEEIASSIDFLLSAKASAIYGVVLFADLGIDAQIRPTHV